MADFEHRQLEIGLEFVDWSFTKCNNFSEGSSKPKEDVRVIQVRGRQPHKFFNSNYLSYSQKKSETLNPWREKDSLWFFCKYVFLCIFNMVIVFR